MVNSKGPRGARNPFAIASLLDRNFDKSRPEEELSRVFKMSLNEIFSAENTQSPMYADFGDSSLLQGLLRLPPPRNQWQPLSASSPSAWQEIGQGLGKDCYLIASLIALRWANLQTARVKSVASGSVTADFDTNAALSAISVTMGDRVPHAATGVLYARDRDPSDGWTGLIEKAWLIHNFSEPDRNYPSYAHLQHGWSPEPALELLTGNDFEVVAGNSDWATLAPADRNGAFQEPVVMWTTAQTPVPYGVAGDHAYAVLGVSGGYLITVDPFDMLITCNDPEWVVAEAHLLGTPWWKQHRNSRASLRAVPDSAKQYIGGFAVSV